MPRSISGVYSAPPGTKGVSQTTIASSSYNTFIDDLVADANAARPITAGGTGAITAVAALDELFAQSTAIASSSTTNLASATGNYVEITGTTTITAFGTVSAGSVRTLRFAGALTLTHNATSLILPNGANFTTSAGDVFEFTSEGSGNWRCTGYALANGQAISGQPGETTSAKTSAYTVTTADDQSTILCDATSAAFTVTLPAAATAGDGFVVTVKKTDSSANAVTLDGNGSETIDGATTYALDQQHQSVILICNGTGWYIKNPKPVFDRYFESAGLTITAAGALTVAHTLGIEPKAIQLVLECQTNNGGYLAGEKVFINPHFQVAASQSQGVSVIFDESEFLLKYADTANTFAVISRVDGTRSNLTNSSWNLIIRAWA